MLLDAVLFKKIKKQ